MCILQSLMVLSGYHGCDFVDPVLIKFPQDGAAVEIPLELIKV